MRSAPPPPADIAIRFKYNQDFDSIYAMVGRLFPMTYFLPISVGTFTKGLGFSDLAPNLAALVVFIPALTGLNLLLLRKQER